MSVPPEVILTRLAHLGFVLDQLERLRTRANSPDDAALHLPALERALHVAAEALFDIGHHVLAGRGHPVPPQCSIPSPFAAARGWPFSSSCRRSSAS